MFCGIKILNLIVNAIALRAHHLLTFGTLVDTDNMVVLSPVQKAAVRKLLFTLVSKKANPAEQRVELVGSLHKYGRNGFHNADDFTYIDVYRTIKELCDTYAINPYESELNNLEFGVNLPLPFPVSYLLKALITHRGIPFILHTENGFDYYQAKRQQYVVKIYDKGKECNIEGNVLRFEIKVLRMKYLHDRNAPIHVLADLLNQEIYPILGKLLVDTFKEILFDEPSVTLDDIPTHLRELLLKGRNPSYWTRPESNQPDVYKRRKQQQRDECCFRNLLATYRSGRDWQRETATLIQAKWNELTGVPDDGHVNIIDQPCPELTGGCPKLMGSCLKLTGVEKSAPTGELSQINPKDVGVILDRLPDQGRDRFERTISTIDNSAISARAVGRGKADQSTIVRKGSLDRASSEIVTKLPRYCLATGLPIDNQPANKPFVSPETLFSLYENDSQRFDELTNRLIKSRFRKLAINKQCILLAKRIYEEYRNKPVRQYMAWLQTEWKRGKQTRPLSPEEHYHLVNRECTSKDLIKQAKKQQ